MGREPHAEFGNVSRVALRRHVHAIASRFACPSLQHLGLTSEATACRRFATRKMVTYCGEGPESFHLPID